MMNFINEINHSCEDILEYAGIFGYLLIGFFAVVLIALFPLVLLGFGVYWVFRSLDTPIPRQPDTPLAILAKNMRHSIFEMYTPPTSKEQKDEPATGE